MSTPRFRKQLHWFLMAAQLALIGYYFLVYRPLSQTVHYLDVPLTQLREQLISTNAQDKGIEMLDFTTINQTLDEAGESIRHLQATKDQLLQRIRLDPLMQSRLEEPFQLIDYQNERQSKVEELLQLAKTNRAQLDPEMLEALPRYPLDQSQAPLLWAQLSLVHQTTATALLCGVPEIQFIHVPLLENSKGRSLSASSLEIIRADFKMAGSMQAVARFLSCLPLRANEVEALGLPKVLPSKPALFIEKVVVQKRSPQNPDDVQLDLTVTSFVLRQPGPPLVAAAPLFQQ